MRIPDPDTVARIIQAVADEEILPRFGTLAADDIREKGPGDLVTIADERSELRLTRAFTAMLPDSVVVGEEGVAADPRRLAGLHGDAPVWIIDPLDGTRSFTRGQDRFTVIVALAHLGQTVAAWIYRPLDRVMVLAAIGEGASLNGRRLTLPDNSVPENAVRRLSDMTGVFVIPRNAGWRTEATRRIAHELAAHRRINGAGMEYLDLARGRTQVAFFHRLNPWDHAAGVFIHKEAGGIGKLIDGRPYAPTVPVGPLLLAPTPETWEEAAAILGPPPSVKP